jgi:hypothetical protein
MQAPFWPKIAKDPLFLGGKNTERYWRRGLLPYLHLEIGMTCWRTVYKHSSNLIPTKLKESSSSKTENLAKVWLSWWQLMPIVRGCRLGRMKMGVMWDSWRRLIWPMRWWRRPGSSIPRMTGFTSSLALSRSRWWSWQQGWMLSMWFSIPLPSLLIKKPRSLWRTVLVSHSPPPWRGQKITTLYQADIAPIHKIEVMEEALLLKKSPLDGFMNMLVLKPLRSSSGTSCIQETIGMSAIDATCYLLMLFLAFTFNWK